MASFRKKGKIWYYRFVDANGKPHERRGCPDRRETESMASAAEVEASKIRGGFIDARTLGYRDQEVRPLVEHLADWHGNMLAREKTLRHVNQFRERAGKLAAMVGGAKLADLEPGRKSKELELGALTLANHLKSARLSDLAPSRIQSALAALRDADKSPQTVNHYRAALRAFLSLGLG